MTQEAVVNRIIDGKTAEIMVLRSSACGDKCSACGACAKKPVFAVAQNCAGAAEGDRVLVSGSTPLLLKYAFAVYIMPFLLFFVFYSGSVVIFRFERDFVNILFGILGFLLGILFAVSRNRSAGKTDMFKIEKVI